jgi:hypothetical protein
MLTCDGGIVPIAVTLEVRKREEARHSCHGLIWISVASTCFARLRHDATYLLIQAHI